MRPRSQVILTFGYNIELTLVGGRFVLVSGGAGALVRLGAPDTMIADNNHLATALNMCLPLMEYLRQYSKNRIVSALLLAVMGLTVLTVLGTYSRGGLVGLVVVSLFLIGSARKRILLAVCGHTDVLCRTHPEL